VHVFDDDDLDNADLTRTPGRHANQSSDATQFSIAWQSRLLIHPLIEPGFEYYGQINEILTPASLRIGPVLVGLYNFAPYGKLKYELAYLFGLSAARYAGVSNTKCRFEMARGSTADRVIAAGRFTAAWLSAKPARNEPILARRGYWAPVILWMATLLSFGVEL
jgi:hypothetical protein